MTKINLRKNLTIICFVTLTALMLSLLLMPANALDEAVISIVPKDNTFDAESTSVGSTFVVSATVTNVKNLWMWQVKLFFNAHMINCTDASIPSDSPFNFSVQPPPEINNVTGYVMLGASRVDSVGVNGSGVLATVTFKIGAKPATSEGSLKCSLSLGSENDTYLYNPKMEQIPATLENGYYEIPEFTGFGLLLVSLVATLCTLILARKAKKLKMHN